ncbi:MAG: type II toxin-antitoxin system VapC family toxin [Tepidiformaceae bacterium]
MTQTVADPPVRDQVVIDASAIVAMLVAAAPNGAWVADAVGGYRLAAPTLLPYEVASTLRSLVRTLPLDRALAAQALGELDGLPIAYTHFAPLADRIWSLRDNLTACDAAYVSLAELLQCPLVTLDARIAAAPGLQCEVRAYPG